MIGVIHAGRRFRAPVLKPTLASTVSDICSHQDVSLSEGEVDDCAIECWLHGSRFDLRTGAPSALPATRPIPVYRLEVRADDVWVDVSTGAGVPADEAATSKES